MSSVNAWKARQRLAAQIARGESGIELAQVRACACQPGSAEAPGLRGTGRPLPACGPQACTQAALLIAAEDDALVSHSTVELPVASFLARIERLVDTLGRSHVSPDQPPEQAVQASTCAFGACSRLRLGTPVQRSRL